MRGFLYLGVDVPIIPRPPTKLIVCGLPRSGTTGMVSCLASAGIPFGSNLSNVKEDQDFRHSLKGSLRRHRIL